MAKPLNLKIKLPKSISKSVGGKYRVIIAVRGNKQTLYGGTYDTIAEAVIGRDKFVTENYHDSTKGYMPRGIGYNKNLKCYTAYLKIDEFQKYLGKFDTLNEAIEFRKKFLESLT
jgi:hypothetical protein